MKDQHGIGPGEEREVGRHLNGERVQKITVQVAEDDKTFRVVVTLGSTSLVIGGNRQGRISVNVDDDLPREPPSLELNYTALFPKGEDKLDVLAGISEEDMDRLLDEMGKNPHRAQQILHFCRAVFLCTSGVAELAVKHGAVLDDEL